MNWMNWMNKQKKDCWMNIDCRFQKKKRQSFEKTDERMLIMCQKNDTLEKLQKTEHIKKCQKSREMIHTKDSKIYRTNIDLILQWFETLRITIESKNELFCALQLQKHLDVRNERENEIVEMYETMTDETELHMQQFKQALKKSEWHWTIVYCEKNKHFDVFQIGIIAKNQMTIEKDMQHHHLESDTENRIWLRVLNRYIENEILIQQLSA